MKPLLTGVNRLNLTSEVNRFSMHHQELVSRGKYKINKLEFCVVCCTVMHKVPFLMEFVQKAVTELKTCIHIQTQLASLPTRPSSKASIARMLMLTKKSSMILRKGLTEFVDLPT